MDELNQIDRKLLDYIDGNRNQLIEHVRQMVRIDSVEREAQDGAPFGPGVKKALDLGFSAVMYDGSSRPYEENVRMTRETVAMAQEYGANVEAEIGIVTGHEGKEFVGGAYTDPELAAKYVKETGIDALAASVGTVHGFYAAQPKLDFDRIVKIRELTGVPLVMHGGSGISVEDTQKAIRCGIRKINYFSYMSNAGVKGVQKLLEEKNVKYFHELANAAIDAMEEDILNAMAMFALE